MAKQYRVVIAAEARNELRKELDYIRRESSAAQARRVNTELQKVIKSLATFPNRHGKLAEISTDQKEYRTYPKWSFMIIYRVEEDGVQVRVVSIFNTNQHSEKIDDIEGR